MKNLYLSLYLFGAALATPSAFAQTHEQTHTKYIGSASTSISLAFTSASTTGNLIVVHLSYDKISRSVNTVVDNKGNTYARINGPTTWNTTFRSELWYAYNIKVLPVPAVQITITATLTGASTSFLQIYMSEYSGISNVSPLDKKSVNTGTATSFNSGSVTTTAPNELIYGVSIGSNGNLSAGGGFTPRSLINSNVVEDKIGATAGSYSSTFGSVAGNHWVAEIATFKPLINLPIDLLSFDALVRNQNTVQLDWATATESNNDHFEIQRSHDGSDWALVSKIKGAGNSNTITRYSSTDNTPYTNLTYYRLAQFDLDGHITYSAVKTVQIAPPSTGKIKIYPVPATDHLTVEAGYAELQSIYVFSSAGLPMNNRIRISSESDSRSTLDLSLLPKGVYFLRMKDKSLSFSKQ
jgi:hypothetical protein